jgi:hypothetical protein
MNKEEIEDALRNLEAASRDLKKGTGGKAGEGSEKRYGQAYYACVKAGIRPPLKGKYR